MTKPIIEMKGVAKSFGYFQALQEIDLKVREGEIVVIIGTLRVRQVHADPLHQPA
jgi:ABC-type sugar transport system ATPase subunit